MNYGTKPILNVLHIQIFLDLRAKYVKGVGIKTLKSELYQQSTEVGFVTEFDSDYDANMKVIYRLVLPVMERNFVPAGVFPTCIQVVS